MVPTQISRVVAAAAARSRPRIPPGTAVGRRLPAGVLVAGLCGAALAAYVLLWLHLGHAEAAGSDYSASYIAAQGWRDGVGLYDQAAQLELHKRLLPGYRIDLPFITPPTTAVLAQPSTLLGIDAGFRVMSALELLMVAAGALIALRAAPSARGTRTGAETVACALAATAGVGSCVVLWQGQWDGICALALAAAYAAWRSDRTWLAGAVLAAGFGATKPHLALGLVLFLVGTRNLRAVGGMAAGGALVLIAGAAVAGPRGWADWLGALSLASGHSPVPSLLGYTGLAGSWMGDTGAGRVLAAAASIAAVGACGVLGDRVRRHPERLEGALAGAAALSLVASPHLLTHDLAVLAAPAAWMLATAAGSPHLRAVVAVWAALNMAALLDLGNAGVAPPGRLVPVALTGIGALALVCPWRRIPRPGPAWPPVEIRPVARVSRRGRTAPSPTRSGQPARVRTPSRD